MKKTLIIFLLFISFIFLGCNKIKNNQKTDNISTGNNVNSGLILNNGEKKDINEISKDLGNGFILKQNHDNTYIEYNGKNIYSWSNFSKKIPFIWDDGCNELSNKFSEVKSENMIGDWKQDIWNSLGNEGQINCIKENYLNTIFIEKLINDRFYCINKTIDKVIFDTKTNKIYDIKNKGEVSFEDILKIEINGDGIFILYKGSLGNIGGILYINSDDEQKVIFNNTDESEDSENYIEVIDFELLSDDSVKIKYKGKNFEEKEKIVKF